MPHLHKESLKPGNIFMDVYETLLDMSEVEKRVNQLLNSRTGYTVWFELFMQYCFVDNCIDQFNPFSEIAGATMQMAANMLGKKADEQDIQEILELMAHLPIKDGVQEGLSLLNDNGIIVTALTNSPERLVTERMERTGLISYFRKVLSAEHVKKYKPHIDVYRWASEQINAQPGEILLVSAHGWDIAGATNAGMQTAYVKQSRQMIYPLAPQPLYICSTLIELAQMLK